MFIDLHWCSLIFIDFHWISFFSSPSSLLQPKDKSDMWQHILTVSCKSELSCSSYDFRKINHIPIILIFIAVHLFSLFFIDFHWFPLSFIYLHWCSLIFIDVHWSSLISLDVLLFFSLLPPPAKRWVRYVATFPDSFMQIRAIVLELRLPKD